MDISRLLKCSSEREAHLLMDKEYDILKTRLRLLGNEPTNGIKLFSNDLGEEYQMLADAEYSRVALYSEYNKDFITGSYRLKMVSPNKEYIHEQKIIGGINYMIDRSKVDSLHVIGFDNNFETPVDYRCSTVISSRNVVYIEVPSNIEYIDVNNDTLREWEYAYELKPTIDVYNCGKYRIADLCCKTRGISKIILHSKNIRLRSNLERTSYVKLNGKDALVEVVGDRVKYIGIDITDTLSDKDIEAICEEQVDRVEALYSIEVEIMRG